MKTILPLALICAGLLLGPAGYAQRHIKGQTAVGLAIGVVDNLPKFGAPRRPGSSFTGGIDYVWYRKNERYWKGSFSYVRKYYAAQGPVKPLIEQYWLSMDYVPRCFYTTRRWLYVAPTAGLYVGYEFVNRNRANLAEGVIQNKSTGSIGPQLGLEAEAYVGPSVAIVGGITERYIPFSEVSKFRTIGYVGIRYCFFR